jgi:hypothetical protein
VVFCGWLLAGQRFEVGGGGGRKRLTSLGAYCPDDQEDLDRRYTDENLNAQGVIELFTVLMSKHPETKHFRIYLDNARYQHAKILLAWIEQTRKAQGVLFDRRHLPADSPNLNLIEGCGSSCGRKPCRRGTRASRRCSRRWRMSWITCRDIKSRCKP